MCVCLLNLKQPSNKKKGGGISIHAESPRKLQNKVDRIGVLGKKKKKANCNSPLKKIQIKNSIHYHSSRAVGATVHVQNSSIQIQLE